MRQILNISLPEAMVGAVEKTVAEGNYASKSEFFRDLLRMWFAGKIVKELAESRNELFFGKGKVLNSLAELR